LGAWLAPSPLLEPTASPSFAFAHRGAVPKVRLLFTLRNPVVRAYSEYLNKRADKTVMRYLHKRIDNKMDKELNPYAPRFTKLVDDVARAMELCGRPNRTFSMMDE
jgi:hypothetical protein